MLERIRKLLCIISLILSIIATLIFGIYGFICAIQHPEYTRTQIIMYNDHKGLLIFIFIWLFLSYLWILWETKNDNK